MHKLRLIARSDFWGQPSSKQRQPITLPLPIIVKATSLNIGHRLYKFYDRAYESTITHSICILDVSMWNVLNNALQ